MLLDSNLNWKSHIKSIALKMSINIGVIAPLRHFAPVLILLSSYGSLFVLYLAVWGQMSSFNLMYFSKPGAHAVRLFVSSKILPINMLLLQTV